MAYIRYEDDETGPEELLEIYRKLSPGGDKLDNILRIHSLNPPSLTHHLELYRHLMRGKSEVSRVEREMIAVAVSKANDCHY